MRLLWPFGSRRMPATPGDADRRALRQLEVLGADLTKPRHVIHFLYFDEEAAARHTADDAEKAGYTARIMPPDEEFKRWRVHADGTRVVGPTTVDAYRAWFERLAASHGGTYDGWEAARKP